MFGPLKPLPAGVSVRPGRWPADEHLIAPVRRTVFIEEQAVPEALEWEAADADCDWFIALAGGDAVGIARLTPAGRIGRMAVLAGWRGQGIGSALLAEALAQAGRRGLVRVDLHAQCHALGFYERFGFIADGPDFFDAGIPHRHMILRKR
jgi:predicted GNAT family N-acyltransferase